MCLKKKREKGTFLLKVLFISPIDLSNIVIALSLHCPFPWLLMTFSISLKHFCSFPFPGESIFPEVVDFERYSSPLKNENSINVFAKKKNKSEILFENELWNHSLSDFFTLLFKTFYSFLVQLDFRIDFIRRSVDYYFNIVLFNFFPT